MGGPPRHSFEYLGSDAIPVSTFERLVAVDRTLYRMLLARSGSFPKYYLAGLPQEPDASEEEK